jgi:hypothetical protein
MKDRGLTIALRWTRFDTYERGELGFDTYQYGELESSMFHACYRAGFP